MEERKQLNVLIVEDSLDDALLLVDDLKRGGYDLEYERVDTARDMRAALDRKSWDLVIADYSMPWFSGLSALRILKEKREDVPFIVVSGTIGEDVAVEAVKAGASDYVMKDKTARLLPAIDRALREAEAGRRHKRTEEALKASEAGYRAIFNEANDAIFLAEAETGIIIDANKKAEELLGLPADMIIGMHQTRLHPKGEEERYRKIFEQSVLAGWAVSEGSDLYLCGKDGRLIPVEISSSRLRIGGREVLQGIFRDITERKRAEQALQESEDRYRRTLDSMGDPIHVVDRDMRIILINGMFRKWNEKLGFETEAVGKTIFEVYPFLTQKARNEYERVFESGQMLMTEETVDVADRIMIAEIRKIPALERGEVVRVVTVVRDITEQRHAEEALRQSEEHFRMLIENALDAIVIVDSDLTVLYESPSVERILGHTQEEMLGKAWLEIIHPDDTERVMEAVARAMQESGAVMTEALRCRRKDGSWRTIEASGRRIPGEDALIANYRDITERKRAEDELASSLSLLSATLESTPDGILVVDPKGGIMNFNRKFLEMWGISEEMIASGEDFEIRMKMLNLAKYPEKTVEETRKLYDHPERESFAVLELKDGRIFERYSKPQKIGERTVGIVVAFRDVTESKRVEDALRGSEEKYRLLVENANDAIFILQDGVMKFHNSRTVKLIGRSADELARTPFPKLIHPDDREFVEGIYRGRMEGKEVPNTYSFRIIGKAGEILSVQINTVLIVWEEKPAALGFLRDITLQKRLEAQLQHAQKMESIGTLAGGIAHDFNNILGGILGYASFMKNKMTEDHAFYGYVDTIESGAIRASELTSQLLAFARGGRFNIKPISLNRIVEETLTIVSRTFDKSISIDTRLQADLPTVEADAGQLQQVLLNLCVNARDAMPAGGTLTIESKAKTITPDFARASVDAESGPYVVLTVTDTGMGMDRETAERVFEPFFTTKEEGKGTGLGLSMAYGVIKNHGGFLLVEGELGKGATFEIYLPASGKPELRETPATDAPIGGDELILVVDDEKAIRELAREMLDSFGYRVIAVENGIEAIEVFKERADDIDLVILDMVMPKMGGRETFLKLREMSPAVKVILSTGYSQVGRAQEILDEGVMGFIQKPYQVNTLLATVRNVLES